MPFCRNETVIPKSEPHVWHRAAQLGSDDNFRVADHSDMADEREIYVDRMAIERLDHTVGMVPPSMM
jgi:hypothetical protein